jgi:exodeoxyribonuclease V beta subunit
MPAPVCRSLTQAIASDWRVTSFSGMAAGSERPPQPRDYDALSGLSLESLPLAPQINTNGPSIFDFPRGAAAGTCLHEIFERLDFAALSASQITQISRERLLANGYHEQWLPVVTAMVTAVTRSPLLADRPGFSLSQLPQDAWQSELEFYLPIAQLSPDRLDMLFAGLLNPSLHGDFDNILESLDFRQSRGMLHGFMDMVFVHEGRYYIIDWKSNHLGSGCQQYSPADLSRSMAEHSYILQYHLYTLALDRYLRLRLPGYSYEAHFGGAIYLYLRGISSEITGYGIYRDRPAAEFIRRADELILG